MRTRPGDRLAGQAGQAGRVSRVSVLCFLCVLAALPALPAWPAPSEQADPDTRLRAIDSTLTTFLAEPPAAKRRATLAADTFAAGPAAIGPTLVPAAVMNSLRAAVRDDAPRVAAEALYAFGALSAGVDGADRRDLLQASGPELVAAIGAADPSVRQAALAVIGRVYQRRPGDGPVAPSVGDAIVSAMNESDRTLVLAAIHAVGAMRYERGLQSLTDLFQYHGKGEMAEASFDAVARIAHPSSAALFEAQLSSRIAPMRGIAAEGIARLGDPARMLKIQAALERERDAGVLLAEAFAACRLAKAPLDALVEGMRRDATRDQTRNYLWELAPGHAQAFAAALRDGEPQIRLAAVDALGFGGDRAALPLVEAAKTDPDPRVAAAAERAAVRLRRVS